MLVQPLPYLKSIPVLLLAIFVQPWAVSVASAEDINVTSEIDAVTVFQTGAEIVRSFTVQMEPGEHRLLLRLPHDIQQNSIQIEGTSQREVSISALDLRLAPADTSEQDARDAELRTQIAALEDEVRRFSMVLSDVGFARELVESLVQRKLLPAGQNTTPPVPEPGALTSLLDMVEGRLSQLSESTLEARAGKAEADEKIAELRARLSEQLPTEEPGWQASIHVVAQNTAAASFLLRYRLNSASWEPLYEARLSTDEAGNVTRLKLVRNATVAQTTTEDWNNVELTLSTAQRTSTIFPPELEPLSIRRFQHEIEEELPQTQSGRGVSSPVSGSAEQGSRTADATDAVSRMQASASIAAFNALYAIPGRVTIDQSGNAKNVRIDTNDIVANLFLVAVPKVDLTAYLISRFTTNNSTPLLPGRVMLFRDEVFVGEGRLPLTAPGETIELGFGADDLVTIGRREVDRKSGETGLVSTVYIEERSFLTTITSSHSFDIAITIQDQVPVSTDERIRVELLPGTTRPNEQDIDDGSGVYSWTETLEPDAPQEIRFGFRVTWPKGLNR